MKYTLALLLAASMMPVGAASADANADVAKAKCTKAILDSGALVTRTDIKNFRLNKTGSGYSFSGFDENHKPVECLAAADGHPTWINGG